MSLWWLPFWWVPVCWWLSLYYADGHYPECHYADWRYGRSVFTPHVVHLSKTKTQSYINYWFNKIFFIRLDSGKLQVNLWLPNPQTSNISILLILALVSKYTLCTWCRCLEPNWGWFICTTTTVKFFHSDVLFKLNLVGKQL